MHFLQFSEEKFSKFSEIFSKYPINCHFRTNPQKIKAWFAKFFWKYAKIIHFLSIFWSKFLKDFLKISQNLCFSSNREKINAWFVKILLKNAFFAIFWRFFKIFSNFSTICICRPNAQKINAWIVKFIEKYARNHGRPHRGGGKLPLPKPKKCCR